MTSNKEFIVRVIEIYKQQTCLWKTTDPDYRNKNKRNEACERILQLFKAKDPNATTETVIKKITSLRGSFRKELNKIRSSEKSGASNGEVHVPKLWYFDLLYFLEDQQASRLSNLSDDMPFDYDEGDIDAVETDSQTSSYSTSRPSSSQGSLKRLRSTEDQVWDKIAQSRPAEIPVSRERYASFGDHVAEKMLYMPPEMVPFCQKLIGDVIFYGEMKNLNITSRIATEYVMSGPSFPQLHPVAPPNASVPSESGKAQYHVTGQNELSLRKISRQK